MLLAPKEAEYLPNLYPRSGPENVVAGLKKGALKIVKKEMVLFYVKDYAFLPIVIVEMYRMHFDAQVDIITNLVA